jgi:hypothetical protein
MWHDVTVAIRDLQRALTGALDPYRPEQHYMRGPGPKCRTKRSGILKAAPQAAADTTVALEDTVQARA